MTSKALFQRGDLLETKNEGGLGVVLRVRSNGHVELDWFIYPKITPYRWEARDVHPDFDLVADPELFKKIGAICLPFEEEI